MSKDPREDHQISARCSKFSLFFRKFFEAILAWNVFYGSTVVWFINGRGTCLRTLRRVLDVIPSKQLLVRAHAGNGKVVRRMRDRGCIVDLIHRNRERSLGMAAILPNYIVF